jgi:hypothetical protein
MKKECRKILRVAGVLWVLLLSVKISTAQLSGTKTIPGNYATIGAALADIQSSGLSGHLVLELQQSYYWHNEFYPLIIPKNFPTGANATVTIRPAAGATGVYVGTGFLGGGPQSTGNIPIFNVYGSYLIFDGRPGGTGNNRELFIWSQAPEGSAIQFTDNASNNTVTHCNLIGINDPLYSGPFGNKRGIVTFFPKGPFPVGILSGITNNTIEHCVFDGALIWKPYYAIYAFGNNNAPNTGNRILNNEIRNFSHAGIEITPDGPGSGWTISGNSFYSTATDYTYPDFAINLNHANNKNGTNIIDSNYIGGNAPKAAGKWLGGPNFGIVCNTDAGGISASIRNNVIKNIDMINPVPYPSLNDNDVFAGISVTSENGTNNMIVSGNLIGGSAGDFGISVNAPATGGDARFYGILYKNCSRGSINLNTIQQVKLRSAESSSFLGIKTEILGGITVSQNTIQQLDIQSAGDITVINYLNDPEFVTRCEPRLFDNFFDRNSVSAVLARSTGGNVNFTGFKFLATSLIFNGNIIGSTNDANSITASGKNVSAIGVSIEGIFDTIAIADATIANFAITGSESAQANAIKYKAVGKMNLLRNSIAKLNATTVKAISITPGSGVSKLVLDGNIIKGTKAINSNGMDLVLSSTTDLNFSAKDNTVTDWQNGLLAYAATGSKFVNSVQFNSFSGNQFAVNNQTGIALNATCNWWGHANGPTVFVLGPGDRISSFVLFNPWAKAPGFVAVDAGPDQTIYRGYGTASKTISPVYTSCGIASYRWSTGATTPSIIVSPTVTTSYAITATDANGHSARDFITISVTDIRCGTGLVKICHHDKKTSSTQSLCVPQQDVSIHLAHGDALGNCETIAKRSTLDALPVTRSLAVFPNPSPGLLEVTWSAEFGGGADVYIIDILGRTRQTGYFPQIIGTNKNRIDLKNIENGDYILVLRTQERLQRVKIRVRR